LDERFFAKIAGWQAMQQARAVLAADNVLSSNWTPPILKGVVQEGTTCYRAGLIIKDHINIENLCSCRPSREWGTICAHSVAVGLHHLKQSAASVASTDNAARNSPESIVTAGAGKKRLQRAASGETAELFVIVPPNFEQAAARGKFMVYFEGNWRGGRGPLNALPHSQLFSLSKQDEAL